MKDLLQRYLDSRKIYSFEGEAGVIKMSEVMTAVCGYNGTFGGVLYNFFVDNPGACQAVVEWIGDQRNNDWQDNLGNLVGARSNSSENDTSVAPNDPRDFVVRGYK